MEVSKRMYKCHYFLQVSLKNIKCEYIKKLKTSFLVTELHKLKV